MSKREYWVGLPVGIEVDSETGTVRWTIDISEAADGISEEHGEEHGSAPDVTEDQALLDMAVVSAQESSPAVTTSVLTEMKCPVRYACGFSTKNIGAMAAHILDKDESHGDV